MKVAELMTRDVVTIDADETVDDALALLDEQHIRHLPVVSEGRMVGIVSDRALGPYRITLAQLFEGPERAAARLRTRVAEASQAEVVSITAQESVREAAARMVEQQVSALPVLDDGKLVGMVSWVDVLQAVRDGAEL